MAAAGGGRRREAAEAAKGRDLGVDLGGPGEDDLPERETELPKLFNFFLFARPSSSSFSLFFLGRHEKKKVATIGKEKGQKYGYKRPKYSY